MGFSRRGYWRGLPFPSPEDLPNPGIESTSPALAGGFFTAEPPGLPKSWCTGTQVSVNTECALNEIMTLNDGNYRKHILRVSGKHRECSLSQRNDLTSIWIGLNCMWSYQRAGLPVSPR